MCVVTYACDAAELIPQGSGSAKAYTIGPAVDAAKSRIRTYSCPECDHRGSARPFPAVPTTSTPLRAIPAMPVLWNVKDRSKWLYISRDGLTASNTDNTHWLSARATMGVTPRPFSPPFYFEVTVTGSGMCRVGWSTVNANLEVGADTLSFCYGSSANKGHNNKFESYGVEFGHNDVVGCSLDYTGIWFSLNGKRMPLAFTFRDVAGTVEWQPTTVQFFPAISLKQCAATAQFNAVIKDCVPVQGHAFPAPSTVVPLPLPSAWGVADADADADAAAAAVDTPSVKRVALAAGAAALADVPFNLSDDAVRIVLSFLGYQDLGRAIDVCSQFRQIIRKSHMMTLQELLCFHTKQTFLETTLGVGINCTYHAGPRDMHGITSGPLKGMSAVMDLLSIEAFRDENVRLGVWKERFEHFLPLWINNRHATIAAPLLEHSLVAMAALGPQEPIRAFQPELTLWLISKLMNSTVVGFMRECEAGLEHAATNSRASEKAMQAFSSFHHLLLGCLDRYKLFATCEQTVQAFKQRASMRHKDHCPDLGEFLCNLVGSTLSWHDIRFEFLREMLSRNVMWLLRPHPELAKLTEQTDNPGVPNYCARVTRSFDSAQTGLKLVAFQMYFMTQACGQAPLETLQAYNRTQGQVSATKAQALLRHAKKIMAMQNWADFFDLVQVPRLAPSVMAQLLRDSVTASLSAGYHRDMSNRPHVRGAKISGCCCARKHGVHCCLFSGDKWVGSPVLPNAAAGAPTVQTTPTANTTSSSMAVCHKPIEPTSSAVSFDPTAPASSPVPVAVATATTVSSTSTLPPINTSRPSVSATNVQATAAAAATPVSWSQRLAGGTDLAVPAMSTSSRFDSATSSAAAGLPAAAAAAGSSTSRAKPSRWDARSKR
jgi:hypothetical protein